MQCLMLGLTTRSLGLCRHITAKKSNLGDVLQGRHRASIGYIGFAERRHLQHRTLFEDVKDRKTQRFLLQEEQSYQKTVKDVDVQMLIKQLKVESRELEDRSNAMFKTSRAKEHDRADRLIEPPVMIGKHEYYSALLPDNELAVFCRKSHPHRKSNKQAAQILLDLNQELLGKPGGFIQLGEIKVVADESAFLYTLNEEPGEEFFDLYLKVIEDRSISEGDELQEVVKPIHLAERVHSFITSKVCETLIDGTIRFLVFYTQSDLVRRPSRVHCKEVCLTPGVPGASVSVNLSDASLVLEELDERFVLDVTSTRNSEYILVNSHSRTTSEVHLCRNQFFPITELGEVLQLAAPRRQGIHYFVEHLRDHFLFVTNDVEQEPMNSTAEMIEYQAKLIPVHQLKSEDRSEASFLGDLEQHTCVEELETFSNHVVLFKRNIRTSDQEVHIFKYCQDELQQDESGGGCKPQIKICSEELTKALEDVLRDDHVGFSQTTGIRPFPMEILPVSMPEFQSNILRFKMLSLWMPEIAFEYDLDADKLSISSLSELAVEILRDQDKLYHSRIEVSNEEDGYRFPNTILFHKQGVREMLLHGEGKLKILVVNYGSYGINNSLRFDAVHYNLVQNHGFILVHAHIRGGAEKGRQHYYDGKLQNKKNSMSDYASVIHYLRSARFHQLVLEQVELDASENSTPDSLDITGSFLIAKTFSAGGIVPASLMVQAPQLFDCIILNSPFVNVLRTMLDSSLPLTSIELEEWGNPARDAAAIDCIRSYDPMCLLEEMQQSAKLQRRFQNSKWPSLIVSTSLNDQRVHFSGPAEFVHRYRKLLHLSYPRKQQQPTVIFKWWGTTHFGEGGAYGQIDEESAEFALALQASNKSLPDD